MATSIFFKIVFLVFGLSLCSCGEVVEPNANLSNIETVTASQLYIINSTTSNSSLITVTTTLAALVKPVNDVVQHNDPNAVNSSSTISSHQSYTIFVILFLSAIIIIIILAIGIFLKQQGNYQVRNIFRYHETPV